jgi:Na+-driven multidrug efflux pump
MISKISKIGKFPVIGAFFHPSYLICNTIIFRQRTMDQAALSLGSMVLSLCMLSLGFTFNGSLDTLISQAFGQGDKRLCRVYLNRQLYMMSLFFILLSIPGFFTKQILMGFG